MQKYNLNISRVFWFKKQKQTKIGNLDYLNVVPTNQFIRYHIS